MTVLVLYGLSRWLNGHYAEACYPAAGWNSIDPGMSDHELKVAGLDTAVNYRGGLFGKKNAGINEYTEVIYSFRFADRWITEVSSQWKWFRRHPGMFKIQLARQVHEFDVEKSPSVRLLGDLVQAIEERLPRASNSVTQKP